MLRLLLFAVCLGSLQAKVHITLRPKEVISQPITTTEDEPAPITQLLDNIKAKGVQAFVGEISVGTPPQLMSVTFETATAVSYFPSVHCEGRFCKTRRRYNASASSTYEEVGTPFNLPYGQNASGVLSKDSIGVAGVTIQGHVFGEATAMWSKWFEVEPQDGVLGLGLAGSAPEGVTPILDNMAAQGLIPERVFGLWLGRDPAGGELTLGGLNEQLYIGEMTWVNMRQPADQWWEVPAQELTFDGHPELDICAGGNCTVMTVTGTPYFLTSMAKAKAINHVLGGIDIGEPGAAALDCTTLYKLPTFKMVIGGRAMEMGPLEYTFIFRFEKGLQMCISGFIGLPHMDDHTLTVGTLFMQKFYTAYDRENGRMGFAVSM